MAPFLLLTGMRFTPRPVFRRLARVPEAQPRSRPSFSFSPTKRVMEVPSVTSCGEPHLDLARSSPDSPLLGDVGAVGQELRQDLEPGHHIGRQSGRQHRDRLEHAVDPPADIEPIGTGVKMDVAGLRGPGLRQDLLDNVGGIPRAGRVQASEILR